jgi:hypothetical protein
VSEGQDTAAPGLPLEGARVVKPEHEAEHARHQAVLAALGRIEALLQDLVQAVQGGGQGIRAQPARPKGASRPK